MLTSRRFGIGGSWKFAAAVAVAACAAVASGQFGGGSPGPQLAQFGGGMMPSCCNGLGGGIGGGGAFSVESGEATPGTAASLGGGLGGGSMGCGGMGCSTPPKPNPMTSAELVIPPTPPLTATRLEGRAAVRDRLAEKLNRPISVEFRGVALDDAIATIGEKLGETVAVDKNAIDEFNIDFEQPVDETIRDLPALDVFEALLAPLGLAVVTDRGRLEVTHVDIANERLMNRVYPVSDLAAKVKGGKATAQGHREVWLGKCGEVGRELTGFCFLSTEVYRWMLLARRTC